MKFSKWPIELLMLLSASLPATAAPFCVESEAFPAQCIYFDAGSCNERARQLDAYCSVNQNEVHPNVTAAMGHYCLLTSNQVSMCIYTDRANCDRDAQQQHGACVEASGTPESLPVDPYRNVRPSMAGY